MAQQPGYILHADPEWVQFHLTHSVGRTVGYCRGSGAPMKNVQVRGKLFFLNRGASSKQVAFWADFVGDPLVSVTQAWTQFGRELGADSAAAWDALVARLPVIREKGELRVIRGENATVPREPISLQDAGVQEVQHATKGWSIDADEVEKLLWYGTVRTAVDLKAPPPARVSVTVSRIVRDTQLADRVKRMHNFQCQICGHTIRLADGSCYAEGHHIQPLGTPHNGPDVLHNIVCLCPNHHAACDFGAIKLSLSELRQADGHTVSPQYVEYHNRVICQVGAVKAEAEPGAAPDPAEGVSSPPDVAEEVVNNGETVDPKASAPQ